MENKHTRRGFTQTAVNNTVILNLIQDLQRLPLQLLNNLRGRFQIKFGMTSLFNHGAFTLIELLVVVLIIGILAAVAVPQYQKAVEKTKGTHALALLRQITLAQNQYYLANGKFAEKFADLDIDIPFTGNVKSIQTYVIDWISDEDWSLHLYKDPNSFNIHIVRLTGPYKGVEFEWDTSQKPTGALFHCRERVNYNNTIKYTNTKGAYCEKIFHGTYVGGRENQSYSYSLPNF